MIQSSFRKRLIMCKSKSLDGLPAKIIKDGAEFPLTPISIIINSPSTQELLFGDENC